MEGVLGTKKIRIGREHTEGKEKGKSAWPNVPPYCLHLIACSWRWEIPALSKQGKRDCSLIELHELVQCNPVHSLPGVCPWSG